jgi:hypothetical protein
MLTYADICQEANSLLAGGNMQGGMSKMKEAMAADPSLAGRDLNRAFIEPE